MTSIPAQVQHESDTSSLDAIFDFDALAEALDKCSTNNPDQLINPDLIKLLKAAVTSIDEGIRALYEKTGDVNSVVYGRSLLTDRLITDIHSHLFADVDQELSLIAVGGYGRGELHPKSDIDLMILLRDEENQKTRDTLEKYLTLLWDVKLEIGHSVRTLEECVDEAEKDITVATNIMEARLLAGSQKLFEEMTEKTSAEHIWDSKSFFQAKLDEQIQRNGKYNDTAYNLEPNIKESLGGLRDIQMIGWVAKRHFNANSLHDLVREGFLLESELDTLLQGQNLLWRIRCSLHYLTGRREDRLLFDYQRDLAKEFGYQDNSDSPNNEAIEQFMQNYYRTVIELERLNEILLQHFREVIIYADIGTQAELFNRNFQVLHGYLETRREDVFENDPICILQVFTILQDYPEIHGVRASTIREIKKNLPLIDDDFRNSKRAHQLFIKIISGSRGITHELRRMNRYGVLAAYIPAFDSIVGRMQYDLFHAYTVDQHTLFVIRNMRRLSVPDYCHEFPLASGIFQHLDNPSLLYLSGLFHDIAKGRQGDHAELGAVDALHFCQQHDMSEQEADLVSWLVESHLLMSMTAQRKDISDPDVINTFASHVRTLRRLDYLYLLTICDIRGTNPKQWNDWKDKLLAELYNKTAAVINKGIVEQVDKESNVAEIQTASLRRLQAKGINSHQANELWQTLSHEYFQSHTYGQITWHTSLIIDARQKQALDKPLIQARVHESSRTIQLVIYMRDRDRIFYDVVSELTSSEVDIVNAHIVNATDGFALQSYQLTPSNLSEPKMKIVADQVVLRLQERLNNPDESKQTSSDSINSKLKYFSSPTTISFEKSDDGKTTHLVVETIDRTGVLAKIAKAMADCKIKLLDAKIATAGEKALDYFTISSSDDTALSEEQKEILKQHLRDSL